MNAQLFLLLLLRQRPARKAEAALCARCGVDDRSHALETVGFGGAGASGEQTVKTARVLKAVFDLADYAIERIGTQYDGDLRVISTKHLVHLRF